MPDLALPALFAIAIWWLSTGLVLYADSLPRRTFRWSMLVVSALAGLGIFGLLYSRSDTSLAAAYTAFLSGLALWGWHEMSFLTGYLTGPRATPCPAHCSGWQRFVLASQTVIHHELAIAATGVVLFVATYGAENQVGTWTFFILWAMRLSSKMNIFLGVPHFVDEFLPPHLAFLRSYFRTGPITGLYPISLVAAAAGAGYLLHGAFQPGATAFESAAGMLLATLVALGALEHVFMVLPLRDSALWSWLRPNDRHDGSDGDDASSGRGASGPKPPHNDENSTTLLAANGYPETVFSIASGAFPTASAVGIGPTPHRVPMVAQSAFQRPQKTKVRCAAVDRHTGR